MRKTEAEAEGIEGTSTETTLNVAVEAAGGTGEEHAELSTVNEESGHIVGEEHHARCAHPDEEAGSIALHVSNDMSEEKKTVNKQAKQQQQKRLRRCQRKTLKSEDSSRREKAHPKKRNRLKEVSKCKNIYQRQKRLKRQQVIHRILEDFKGIKNIPGIKSAKKKVLIIKLKNEKGEIFTSRKGIVNVFGEFYRKLYDDNEQDESEQEIGETENESSTDVHNNNTNEVTRIPEITTEELRTAINMLKKGKSPDSNGIQAEAIKACDDETREMVRQIFNEIIKRNELTPEHWKKVKIRVLLKKGDVENVSNYRPICSLPALYKLFSTILYGRLYPMLDQNQAEDQAGFRKTYQTTDHLATYRLIEQKIPRVESKCGQRQLTS